MGLLNAPFPGASIATSIDSSWRRRLLLAGVTGRMPIFDSTNITNSNELNYIYTPTIYTGMGHRRPIMLRLLVLLSAAGAAVAFWVAPTPSGPLLLLQQQQQQKG